MIRVPSEAKSRSSSGTQLSSSLLEASGTTGWRIATAQDFGRQYQHGFLPRGIGLAQRPGSLLAK